MHGRTFADRIGMYQQGGQARTSVDQLPPGSIVIDLAGDETCPAFPAGQSTVPMTVWLKVSPTRYVGYGRGGGP
jgi:hypothetical protein